MVQPPSGKALGRLLLEQCCHESVAIVAVPAVLQTLVDSNSVMTRQRDRRQDICDVFSGTLGPGSGSAAEALHLVQHVTMETASTPADSTQCCQQ